MRLLRWLWRRPRPLTELPAPTPAEVHAAEQRRFEDLERRVDRLERLRDLPRRQPDPG